MTLKRMCRLGVVWAAGLLLSACAGGGTNMVDSWKDPSAGPIEFKKVAVFFLNEDQTVRGIGEEEMVQQIKRTVAVPSIALFPQLNPKDIDRIVDQQKGGVSTARFSCTSSMWTKKSRFRRASGQRTMFPSSPTTTMLSQRSAITPVFLPRNARTER